MPSWQIYVSIELYEDLYALYEDFSRSGTFVRLYSDISENLLQVRLFKRENSYFYETTQVIWER